MALYKVIIGIGVVQDARMNVEPVRGEAQTQVEIEVDAVDADAAFDHVQARLQELLSAPLGN